MRLARGWCFGRLTASWLTKSAVKSGKGAPIPVNQPPFPLNLLSSITDALGGVTSFSYDANGNLLSVTDPRNTTTPTAYTYDNMDRLATRKDPLLNVESYQYDAAGNLAQFTDRRGKVTTFNYDGLNRRTFAGFGTQAGPG